MRDLGPHKCSASLVALLHTGSPAGSVGKGSGKDSSIVLMTPTSPSPRQNATRGLAFNHTELSTWSQALRAVSGTAVSLTTPTVGTNTSRNNKNLRAECIGLLRGPCAVPRSATGNTLTSLVSGFQKLLSSPRPLTGLIVSLLGIGKKKNKNFTSLRIITRTGTWKLRKPVIVQQLQHLAPSRFSFRGNRS